MSDFDAFLLSLSDDQKAKLMQGLMQSSDKSEPEKIEQRVLSVTEDLEREEVRELGRKPPVVVNEDFTVTRPESSNGKRPVRAKKNQWKDTGENREENFDPQTFEKMGKTARTRPEHKKTTVSCHVCGKSFKADVELIFGEFVRCNRCIG